METDEEYDERAPRLTRHHDTECPAYNTKGRDLEDQPCTCGARVPSARDNATRLAARREVVDYLLGRIAAHRQGVSARDARDLAVDDVLRKYRAEAQPVQQTEERR
jgi:hypothetical protein